MTDQPNMPQWSCGAGPMGTYEQGIVCIQCKKRFGMVFVSSNGSPHQWISSATCIECFKKLIHENMKYPHAPAMLEWVNGKEPEEKEKKHG